MIKRGVGSRSLGNVFENASQRFFGTRCGFDRHVLGGQRLRRGLKGGGARLARLGGSFARKGPS